MTLLWFLMVIKVIEHIDHVNSGDVIVFDRADFSYFLKLFVINKINISTAKVTPL